jgi:hypothetical protein
MSRVNPSEISKPGRRLPATLEALRSAIAMCVSASRSEPAAACLRANTRANSGSADTTRAGNLASSACKVAAPPSSARLGLWSASRRAASAHSLAAWACWTASTMCPCTSYQAAVARCRLGNGLWLGSLKLEAEQVGEQGMITEP